MLCSQFVLQPLQKSPHRRYVLFARLIDSYVSRTSNLLCVSFNHTITEQGSEFTVVPSLPPLHTISRRKWRKYGGEILPTRKPHCLHRTCPTCVCHTVASTGCNLVVFLLWSICNDGTCPYTLPIFVSAGAVAHIVCAWIQKQVHFFLLGYIRESKPITCA